MYIISPGTCAIQPGWSIKAQHLRKYSQRSLCHCVHSGYSQKKKIKWSKICPKSRTGRCVPLPAGAGSRYKAGEALWGRCHQQTTAPWSKIVLQMGEQGDKLMGLEKGRTSLPCLTACVLEGAGPSGLLVASITSTMQKGSWHFWGGRGTLSSSG